MTETVPKEDLEALVVQLRSAPHSDTPHGRGVENGKIEAAKQIEELLNDE